MRIVLSTLLLLLATAAPAAAAELTLSVGPRDGVVFGEEHSLTGMLTEGGEPFSRQVVTLEADAHPYDGRFVPIDNATTGDVGDYRFDKRFTRNQRLRVVAAGASATGRAAVFPLARISARTVGRNRVRLVQFLRGPESVEVRGRTYFYLGRARAKSARFAGSALPRRRRAGLHVARMTVRVPKRYGGRFSFAACFRASERSGLGDPAQGCPRRSFRLDD